MASMCTHPYMAAHLSCPTGSSSLRWVLTSFVLPVHNQGTSLATHQGHALWRKFLPAASSFYFIIFMTCFPLFSFLVIAFRPALFIFLTYFSLSLFLSHSVPACSLHFLDLFLTFSYLSHNTRPVRLRFCLKSRIITLNIRTIHLYRNEDSYEDTQLNT